jgi:hypothetical protein
VLAILQITAPTPTRDWADWMLWVFNGLLVGAAFLGIGVAVQTLRVFERQTTATEIAAKAAKASADAAVNAERAWVLVGMVNVPGIPFVAYGSTQEAGRPKQYCVSVRVRLVCANQGRTPATIHEKLAALAIVRRNNPLPLEPNFSGVELQDSKLHYLRSNSESVLDYTLTTENTQEEDMESILVVYGVIKYRHLFLNIESHTTFAFQIGADGKQVERLIGYPKSNEST